MQIFTPYLFLPKIVREVVQEEQPGSYVLGNNEQGFVAKYVGRSDGCLRTRLANHNYLYEFEYFFIRYAKDEKEAFAQECELWHAYELEDHKLMNRIHPAAPQGMAMPCPYCHFSYYVSRLLKAA